jgi:hypothetical protein
LLGRAGSTRNDVPQLPWVKASFSARIRIICFASLVWVSSAAGSTTTKDVRLYADLDGDGHVDSVTVIFVEKYGRYDHYEVRVGSAVYEGLGQYLDVEATIVDVDSTDRLLEIAIPEAGPSSDPAVFFLRYEGGRVRLIGYVPGYATTDGSGTITTECRGTILCTWFYPCSYRWFPEARTLAEVPQAFKPMHVEVTLKHDLSLCPEPWQWRGSTSLKAGTRAIIDLTDDKRWCHIRSAQGEEGWFSVDGGRVYPDRVAVSEVFDGLPIVD